MHKDKLKGLIGLAMRAGKLACGQDAVRVSLKSHSAKLVLADEASSRGSLEKLEFECTRAGMSMIVLPEDLLSEASGKLCKAAAITDENFSKQILKLI
ncbi:MAG: ribosomal L7Ae/L30e/S12e/Gadd45 family protein [Clostridia bacterium]|nr:ribosomal L7Ae/L30e/S12e/Gadd45 family protein [Clostridia bacterium]